MAVQLNSRILRKCINNYHKQNFGLSAEWQFFATWHQNGPLDGMLRAVKKLAAKQSLQRVYIIKFKGLMNFSITETVPYTA
jgi:hypothetical protein